MLCIEKDTLSPWYSCQKYRTSALTGETEWDGHRSTELKIASSIPDWDRCLGYRPVPFGCVQEATDCCFSHTSVLLSVRNLKLRGCQ